MFEFKKEAKIVETENEYDSLFVWGEIVPEDLLEDPEQIKEIYQAMATIDEFVVQLEDNGLLHIIEENEDE